MAVKCSKCGADIPDNAAFCPSCGAQKPQNVQPSQPAPQPPTNRPPQQTYSSGGGQSKSGLEGFVKTIFSKMFIMLGVCIGVLIAWIGSIINLFAGQYANVGSFLSGFGFLGAGLMMFGGGFLNHKIDKYIRLGLVLIGGYIIITAVFSSGTGAVNLNMGGLFGY